MANRSVEHFHIHFVPWKLQGKYLRKMLQNQGFPIVENLDL
jgi:diadenosine tetraphosphate (Ap4A) HIT family hydrolase